MTQVLKSVILSAVALGFALCVGCAGRQAAPASVPGVLRHGTARSVGVETGTPAIVPQPAVTAPVPPPAIEAPRPARAAPEPIAPEPTPAGRTASLLKRRFIVSEPSPFQLVVKNPGTVPVSSLFEEAIALGKIRGMLKSRHSVPPGVSEKTTIREGTVTIPFGGGLAPAEAAAAISGALEVDGVQRVNAVWSAPPR